MTPTAIAFVVGALTFGTITGRKLASKVFKLAIMLALIALALIGALALI